MAGTVVTTNLVAANNGGIVVTDAPGTVVTSNSVLAFCSGAITLAGSSSGSTVENNVVSDNSKSSCPSQPDLSVSAGSITGTKADYNVLQAPPAGGASYGWGSETAATQDEFTQKSGQGVHDFTPASVDVFANTETATTDSADANAPGELDSDLRRNPRVDDPLADNTGTGAGYYDRGALELQDTLQTGVSANADPRLPPALNAVITFEVGGAWGPVTGTLDFGDGSPKMSLDGVKFYAGKSYASHSYPAPGSYTITLTVTDGTVTRTSTTTAVIQPPAMPGGVFHMYQSNPADPQVYFDVSAVSPWPVAKYVMDFGDGSPKVELLPSGQYSHAPADHTYPGAGRYNVTETVTDDHGRSASTSQIVDVRDVPPLNRTMEVLYGGTLSEFYSYGNSPSLYGGPVGDVPYQASAIGFSYSPSGARVIEAIENGQLHEIYSASDGWHDNAIDGVGGNVSALSFSYNQSGDRVIEAVESSQLHEIYTDAGGWHDNAVDGIGGVGNNITALSFKLTPNGDRVIEAIESNMVHEIYTSGGSWWDTTMLEGRSATAVSPWLR